MSDGKVVQGFAEGSERSRSKKKIDFGQNYDEIERFLVGLCGKSERDAMYVSAAEYESLVWGYRRRQTEEWERARWQMFIHTNLSPFVKRKPRRPEELLRLDGDVRRNPGSCKVTEAEQKELNRIFEDFNRRRAETSTNGSGGRNDVR